MKIIKQQTAVMLTVNELLSLGGFSAYEVTTLIRQRVDNQYLISDIDPDVVNGIPFTEIVHSEVRDIIVELYDNGLFQASKSYGVGNGGQQYIIYNALSSMNTPNTSAVASIINSNHQATQFCIDRVNAYLTNKGSATIKEIQSALKIKGLTCNDIATLLGIARYDGALSTFIVTR